MPFPKGISTEEQIREYKLLLLRAAANDDLGPLRRFLQDPSRNLDLIRNEERQTILHVSALEGCEVSVSLILSYERILNSIDLRDKAGRTPLHLAAAVGFPNVIRRLLAAKAGIDLQDDKGCTALHLAVRFDWPDAVRMLLEANADPLVEDLQGSNAVDLASTKEDGEAAILMVAYAGRRRQAGGLEGIKRCIFPPSWQKSSRQIARPPTIPLRSPDRGCGVGRLEGPLGSPASARSGDPLVGHSPFGSPLSSPEQGRGADRIFSAIDEACNSGAPGSNDVQGVIEWHGLEPVLVRKAGEQESAGARTTDDLAAGSWWRRTVADYMGPQAGDGLATDARHRSSSAPPGEHAAGGCTGPTSTAGKAHRGGPTTPRKEAAVVKPLRDEAFAEFAIFRLQMIFGEQVKRLEFEVEWKDEQPSSGVVKPGGEADQRGMVRDDRIIEINGKRTSGKGRDDLLPLLKQRPLTLKVDREAQVMDPDEPHLELVLTFAGHGFSDHGLEVVWRGQLPAAIAVRPQSKAWAAGMLEGDALVDVNGKDVTKCSRGALMSLLEDRPQTVTVWRRPLGMDLAETWSARGAGARGRAA